MCSHLRRKLFEEDGEYHQLWLAMQDDPELTAVVRSRQLHIYRNVAKSEMKASSIAFPNKSNVTEGKGKKILVLAGKAAPKVIRDDRINEIVNNIVAQKNEKKF